MTTQESYSLAEVNRSVEIELERLRVQTVLGWSKESRALTWFGLRDGMSVLEVGMGPGYVTQQLLDLVPSSVITGLDSDPLMIAQAERILQDKRADRVRLVESSIMQMPLPDNSYDFALARFLFQHLPDPVGAAKEVLRVLKPGGKFVIHDIDGEIGGAGEPAPPEEIREIYERAGKVREKKGGNPRIGRRLPRILKEAGYQNLDLDIMVVHSDLVGLEPMAPLFEVDLWRAFKMGLITEAEMTQVQDYQRQILTSPDSLNMYTLLFACGQKPL